MVAPAVVAGAGVALGIGQTLMGFGARKKAKKAAKKQARLTRVTREEEIRQLRLAQRRQEGQARLAAYASNLMVEPGQSTSEYINLLRSENSRQLRTAEAAAYMEEQAIRAGAAGAGDSLIFSGLATAAQSGLRAWELYNLYNTPDTGISQWQAETLAPDESLSYSSTPRGMQA